MCTADKDPADGEMATNEPADPADPADDGMMDEGAWTCSESAIRKVDLLLVVDDSLSMIEEQEKLQAKLPELVSRLVAGVDIAGQEFPPLLDLHVGVLTPNMGLPGLTVPRQFNCDGYGDDGLMLEASRSMRPACQDVAAAAGERFLRFDASVDNLGEFSAAVGCLAETGTSGCGYEMPLDATLKGLWPDPSHDLEPISGLPRTVPSYTFFGEMGMATHAHGTAAEGSMTPSNASFLRGRAADEEPSLLVVLVLTDEDDCSPTTLDILAAAGQSTQSVDQRYLADIPPNLRCIAHDVGAFGASEVKLQPTGRYVQALKALRPGREDLVMFAAVSGIPLAAASPEARAKVDWSDATAREAYYTGLLADPLMQYTLNPEQNNIAPACKSSETSSAFPARRLVSTARGFGEQGRVYSVCDDDFSGAFDDLATAIGERLRSSCGPTDKE